MLDYAIPDNAARVAVASITGAESDDSTLTLSEAPTCYTAPFGVGACTTDLYYVHAPDAHCWSRTEVIWCGPGAEPNGGGCQECPDERTSAELSTEACALCPSNATHNANKTACVCVAGFHADDSTSECTACAPNTYKADLGDDACVACAAHEQSEAWATECVCDPGFERTGQGNTCTACAAGTYKTDAGDDGCTPCAEGTTSAAGSTDASACQGATAPCPEFNALTQTFDGVTASDVLMGMSISDTTLTTHMLVEDTGSSRRRLLALPPARASSRARAHTRRLLQAAAINTDAHIVATYTLASAGECVEALPLLFAYSDNGGTPTLQVLSTSGATRLVAAEPGLVQVSHGLDGAWRPPVQAHACLPCPAGHRVDTNTATRTIQCTACPAKQFPDASTGTCSACELGKYLYTGMTACARTCHRGRKADTGGGCS